MDAIYPTTISSISGFRFLFKNEVWKMPFFLKVLVITTGYNNNNKRENE